ncbi:peptide deformylase [Hutsoniella sourekii]|uniref:peptide deformylase n=1 Tax=Hutsoniella sourekii TaxID=87650 RepID=UPI000482C1FC|nr:peptide deformylase [Hutsoniella sourekii]
MITMKDFIPEQDPLLRKEVEPVTFPLSEELRERALEMRQFLIDSQTPELAEKYQLRPGVGVAGPQIGLDQQIFAIYLVEYDEDGQVVDTIIDQIFINPKIKSHSVQEAALKEGEGCLSVPREVPGLVPRAKRVTLTYQDLDGNSHEIKLRNYEAIVVQHEYDHLKGILFYDHINPDQPWKADPDLELL